MDKFRFAELTNITVFFSFSKLIILYYNSKYYIFIILIIVFLIYLPKLKCLIFCLPLWQFKHLVCDGYTFLIILCHMKFKVRFTILSYDAVKPAKNLEEGGQGD